MNKPNSFAARAAVQPAASTDDALYGTSGPLLLPAATRAVAVSAEGEKPAKVPLSTQVAPDAFLLLKQLETYGGESITEIVTNALRLYAMGKPEAHQPLPGGVLAKLRAKFPTL